MQKFTEGNVILGNQYAKHIREGVKQNVELLKARGTLPCLFVILVGNDPASKIYVSSKQKFANECGMRSEEILLPDTIKEEELVSTIQQLNNRSDIHGILVQMPLPKHMNPGNIINTIDPTKDIDGFHPTNMGKLFTNSIDEKSLMPCTPLGCMHILESLVKDFRGQNAVVIGSSNIVGKPLAAMLMNKGATVSVLNSSTKNREIYTKNADILITACGVPNLISSKDINNPIILDVGINRLEDGSITGDCNFEECKTKAKFITPVPRGVGPMTIAMLLRNTVIASQ